VEPRAGLDDVEKEKCFPHRDSNSDLSVVQPVASRHTNYAIPAPSSSNSSSSSSNCKTTRMGGHDRNVHHSFAHSAAMFLRTTSVAYSPSRLFKLHAGSTIIAK
jgi:hypothetical protein